MPSDDSSWILSLIVMEQYNGEPGALRGACPVLREDCANLPPKGGKAALSYSTLSPTLPSTPPTGSRTSTPTGVCHNKKSEQEGYFSMMKLERIIAEIEKTKDTISKQQARLRELEAQKTEVENLQIVQMVRALRMTPAELSAFLHGKPDNAPAATADRLFSRQEDTENE